MEIKAMEIKEFTRCKERKERGENFSQDEVLLLLKLIGPHKTIVDSKMCSGNVIVRKNEIWAEVANEHTVRAGILRTEAQLRGLYHRLKKFARKEYVLVKQTGDISCMKPASLEMFRMNPNDIRPTTNDPSENLLVESLLAESGLEHQASDVKQEMYDDESLEPRLLDHPTDLRVTSSSTRDVTDIRVTSAAACDVTPQQLALDMATPRRFTLLKEKIRPMENGMSQAMSQPSQILSVAPQTVQRDFSVCDIRSLSSLSPSGESLADQERAVPRTTPLDHPDRGVNLLESRSIHVAGMSRKRKIEEPIECSMTSIDLTPKMPELKPAPGKSKRNDLQSQLMMYAQKEHELKMEALGEKLTYRRLKRHCAELRLMQLQKEFDSTNG